MTMAYRQVIHMTIAALAQRLDVLQGGMFPGDMVATQPARHRPVQLTGNRGIDLVSGQTQLAHAQTLRLTQPQEPIV